MQRAQVLNASMASLVTTRSQICKNGGISSQAMPQQHVDVGNEDILPSQDAVGNNLKVKKGTDKTMVAPGSLGNFLRMKKKLRANMQLSKLNDPLNQLVENVEKAHNPLENISRVREMEDDNRCRFGLVDEDEDFQISGDDYVTEEQLNAARLGHNTNESTQIADKQPDRDVLIDSSLLHLPSYSLNSPTIFRVDHDTRHGSEKLYDPIVVSIGPFHHQTAHLQKMQLQKLAYLKCLLKRRGESTVDKYVAAVRSLEEKARNSYSEPIELNTDEFVTILVLDGLFVVELLRKDHIRRLREKNDPIFRLEHILVMVQRDLMLVENQVPFFVLHRLFTMTRSNDDPCDNIFHLVHNFTTSISPWPKASKFFSTPEEYNGDDHLLGLVYQILFSSFEKLKANSPVNSASSEPLKTVVEPKRSNCHDFSFVYRILFPLFGKTKAGNPVNSAFSEPQETAVEPKRSNCHDFTFVYKILCSFFRKMKAGSHAHDEKVLSLHSASELQERGVEFESSNYPHINFVGGVLRIPELCVGDQTESILRNLMVYEQLFTEERPKYVTDYTFFLQCLVNQSRDVEILRRRGILENLLGGDEMVCPVFASLGRNTMISTCDFNAGVYDEVNRYCSRRRNRWMAVLRRDYFSSPWSFIKFCAASLLLLLTVIQTTFAVLGYWKPNN
ncbi:Unknown protein [Striga hermonthica]|uniref:Uncharacterized protein n=1 Tax=Striga hermonthica TaxID=68872 RepID=A0A9N7NQA7_STRHE|nr:Unknown protein [Striga hermonthica]